MPQGGAAAAPAGRADAAVAARYASGLSRRAREPGAAMHQPGRRRAGEPALGVPSGDEFVLGGAS